MRVIRKPDFLALPPGIIYAKGGKWYFDGLSIKGGSLGDVDWYELNPCWVSASDSGEAADRLDSMLDKEASFPMEDAFGRNGEYEADALFLIFEKDDLTRLRDLIDGAIALAQ